MKLKFLLLNEMFYIKFMKLELNDRQFKYKTFYAYLLYLNSSSPRPS